MALRIILSVACVLWICFIFSNSLQSGSQSSEKSSTVVDVVQSVAQMIAPDSYIATASGEDYDKLHKVVRKLAHFTEYAILGGLLCWCYFSYTDDKKWLWTSAVALLVLPFTDETLQKFVQGRAGRATDILIDLSGELVGFAFAWLLLFLFLRWRKGRREKKQGTTYELNEEKGE